MHSAFPFSSLLSTVLVKCRIAGVKIPGVQIVLCYAQSFAESLKMNNFPFSQELYRITYIRIVSKPEDIVVGCTCLLLCCHVLSKVSYYIAFALKICRCKGNSRCCNRIYRSSVVYEIGVKAALFPFINLSFLNLFYCQVSCKLVKYCRNHLNVSKFFCACIGD